ncbi:epidermal retinol dehydrogenase 2-like isoform X2 [Ruditapes philippinarum]|uniref:epidermal retinol dehydrogenase 2-like isoform X2 n=1 Tax=Ruditapes philippinarum TaxID=129788 RepID=UPI00295BD06A|nr:epidermal retinol dehydrogenase 2-like isoform X2 [Ruditapes philippinarum]
MTEDTPLSILVEGVHVTYTVIKALILSIFRFFVPANRKSVQGEIVLVTGSGGAIGSRICTEFSRLGATLVLWDINERANEQTAEKIRTSGGKCFTYTVDVGNHDDVYKTGQKVTDEVGEVTILVNNAAVVIGRKLLDCPDHEIEKTFDVNLLAQFWTVKCFLPAMLRRNHGHIVNIASSTGLVGLKNLSDYSSSKYGIVGFTEVLHYEIIFSGYSGVHTTLVCPSFVNTKLFDGCKYRFPRLLSPLEVNQCVDRIMQAVLTNQIFVCIPRIVYFFTALKTVLPVTAMNALVKYLGAAQFMDTYVGKPESRNTDINNTLVENGNDNLPRDSDRVDVTRKKDI